MPDTVPLPVPAPAGVGELPGSKGENSPQPDTLLLAGPTASGKSDLALELAARLGGEIISVDSMQVYRGLDIGTAKPGPAERARVPHHLLDVAEVSAPFDAAQFAEQAHAAVVDIHQRGRVAILCGGTGLYFRAFLDGLGEAPATDMALRLELETTPLETLLAELAERDAVTYARIDRQNPRRVFRAVEVIRLTGRPFSEQRASWPGRPAHARQGIPFFCLAREPGELHARIEARVDMMFARGLVEETRRLLELGLANNRTAMQAIGYRQVIEHLQGERGLPETIALVKSRTRQLARRQMTWFRRQPGLEWLPVAADTSATALAGDLLRRLELTRQRG